MDSVFELWNTTHPSLKILMKRERREAVQSST